ncbi:Reductase C-terminal [Paramicrobacterium humi]|uniref:Reductase C-terminal n=1 Tax=Paramicrobacterium humi TaxID=640635 RepID=A0A1H4NU23_9MICO|nr:FAD-dependent oxidoreductase [Microbacterium humi]SEB98308.1 Reductase C-terminal [Microbacterium humi]
MPAFVIVGGGLAAASAAEELRAQGLDGAVTVIAGESHEPYIRPPLSKEVLLGTAEADTAFVHERGWYPEHDIELLTADAATRLDPPGRTVELASGRTISYDELLLATGARARRLEVPGADLPGVHVLRTLEDSEALREALRDGGKRVVTIGGGWIGLEVTAAAATYGNDVTVVMRGEIALASALGDDLGRFFQSRHEAHGVRFVTGANATRLTGEDRVTGVDTDTGEHLAADVVVVGIGAIPNTRLAEEAALDVDDGVLADAALRTSDEHIRAAGDVANAWHPVLERRLRSEHWANAIEQGKAAARSLLGQDVSYDEVPYFYTDQYDIGMEYAGYFPLARDADVLYRGDRESGEFIAFWLRNDAVVAGMNVNVWDVNDDIKELVRSGRRIDRARLADPDVALGDV